MWPLSLLQKTRRITDPMSKNLGQRFFSSLILYPPVPRSFPFEEWGPWEPCWCVFLASLQDRLKTSASGYFFPPLLVGSFQKRTSAFGGLGDGWDKVALVILAWKVIITQNKEIFISICNLSSSSLWGFCCVSISRLYFLEKFWVSRKLGR